MGNETNIRGFDFHCHVDLHANPPNLIQKFEEHAIVVLAVTTTPKAWPQNQKWTAKNHYVYSAVGLHPELVGERYDELALLEDYMDGTRLVGEIGLDGSPHHRKSWERQIEVFSRVLKRANDLGDRVLSIHSRRAANQVVDMMADCTSVNRVLPILHWYSGSKSTAKKAIEHGCYFSINLRMLRSEAGRGLVDSLPKERLLIETDAPFSSLEDPKFDPLLSIEAAEQLARLKGMPTKEFNELLQVNARRVFEFAEIDLW